MEPIWQTKIQMFLKSIPSKTETDRITIINLVELLLNTKLKTYKCILHEINNSKTSISEYTNTKSEYCISSVDPSDE